MFYRSKWYYLEIQWLVIYKNIIMNKYLIFDLKCDISKFFFSLIPKKKKLVLFTSWFGMKYIDNTKYVYEYLLEHSDYKAVWMTKDKLIYNQLKREGKPVEMFGSLRGIILQLRAQAAFSTVQFSDYNIKYLTNCLFVDLGHGHPIKDPGSVVHDPDALHEYKKYFERVYFYAIVASTYVKEHRQITKSIPDNNIIVSGYARNDVFFDAGLRVGKNEIVDKIKNGRKAVVYMPTHRNDGKELMSMDTILPLKKIQSICEKQGLVFIIKKHYYHRNETEDLSMFPNIFDITGEEEIDPQVLLCQADALISDYSACYVDYMLLKRPILFYQYDYERFTSKVRSLLTNFEDIKIAPVSYTKGQFCSDLDKIFNGDIDYLERRMIFAHDYYFDNLDERNAREKVKKELDALMQKYK